MKPAALVLCLSGFAISGNAVFAQALNADDVKWINQCIADNKGGASDTIIRNALHYAVGKGQPGCTPGL
jgi:hypothetical protein